MIQYLRDHHADVLQWFLTHVWLSVLPVVIGLLIALPIGWLAARYRWIYSPLTNLAGVLYTIPSVALFVIMPSILHTKILSPINVVVALTVYSVALLVRVVADGLSAVPAEIRETFSADFADEDRRRAAESDLDFEADDPPEPIRNGHIDLGELAAEHLALALNPYPRAPDAAIPAEFSPEPDAEEAVERPINPFSILKKSN